jgi:hypothetical protein
MQKMKIIKNEKLIKRNSIIGQWTSIIALIVLGGGLYVTFTNPADPKLVTYSLGALVLGFVLTQVGMYLGNRWGRSPRPDEKIDASLKGLQNDFSIYHFKAPAPHLLVGPAGIWVLLPYRQRGVVTYTKNRWRVGNGGFLQMYMSIFGQEGIGRPDLEADGEIRAVQKLLSKTFDGNNLPNVQAALIFVNEAVEIQAEDAPLPAMKLKQLKDFMRQKAKENKVSAFVLDQIKTTLEQ